MAKLVDAPDTYEYERELHSILADLIFNINIHGHDAGMEIMIAIKRIKSLDQNFGHYLDAKVGDIPDYNPSDEPDLSELPF